ncbi:hypothetical protein [Sporosarcina newyorkensis]|uniref:Uncharacterized protein n=1 Tax=Sporosarcina newyorkensis TaxID=759851 RepID=A0A1T4XGP5_9BACL|nr:hypothetical protein [Sporosarcina newyorkensis]SKA88736.1 hypothetical protein SAMN04244570_0732 [Sporosarcina newyorkensis]
MTNFEKMKAAQAKMYEIKQSTTDVALEYKTAFAEKQSDLTYDRTLSPHGRLQKLEDFKKEQGAKFIKQAAAMRAEYDKAAIEAQVAAELFLNEDANKPNELAVQTFNRKLSEFETQLLLASDPKKAMTLVKSFVEETQDPYFAAQLKGELPSIIREVTALAGSEAPLFKPQLTRVAEELNTKATAGGYREAQEELDAGSRLGSDIWFRAGTQLNTVQQAVGSEFSQFANNPTDYVGKGED